MIRCWRPVVGAAAVCLALTGCSVLGGVPILGSFVPDPAMENARNQQQTMIANMTIKPEWKSLCDAGKFRSALAYLEAHKDELGETQTKQLTEDTERQCKSHLTERLVRFRRYVGDIKSQSELAAMKSDDFAVVFNLPKQDELLFTTPAYTWASAHFGNFEDFRSRKPSGESLLKAVAEAAVLPPDDDGENRWFDVMETLVFRAMSDAVRAEVAASQDALLPEREERKARAEALRTRWAGMVQSVDERNRPRVAQHEAQLSKDLDGFPQELRELDAIDISACLSANQPEAELRKAEKALKALESRGGISRESRRRLYTMIVTVVSLRTFLAEKEESDAVAELQGYADKLKKAGGPADSRAFGARVQKVFDALLR